MKARSLEQRLLARSVLDPDNRECWLWIGARSANGYGNICITVAPGEVIYTTAHRAAYEALGGAPIPYGWELHHKCRNRACINPAHLEPMRPAKNRASGMRDSTNWNKKRKPNGHFSD